MRTPPIASHRQTATERSNGKQRTTLATIRIYMVAEVLGIPSQEVMDLLKREHGIEVKSASSTVEEIVARQLLDREEANQHKYC